MQLTSSLFLSPLTLVFFSVFKKTCNGILLEDEKPSLTVVHPTRLKLNRDDLKILPGLRAYDISNGTLLHLKCVGSQLISWNFPTNHFNENDSIANIAQISQSCRSKVPKASLFKVKSKKQRLEEEAFHNDSGINVLGNKISQDDMICESQVILNGTLAEHTGYFSCHYNGSEGFSPPPPNSFYPSISQITSNNVTDVKQAVYFFVNEPGYLLVPPDGNTYIFMSVLSSYPALIPCKPSGSNVEVSLRKTGETEALKIGADYGVYYDATQGFYFESLQFNHSLSSMECVASLNGEDEIFQVNLHFSIDPGNLHPVIDGEEATFVNINSSFALTCSVRTEVGVVIAGMTFRTPVNDETRVVLEDSRSVRGVDKLGGQDQFVVTSRRIIIENAEYSDEGNYTCIVTAQTGRSFSVDQFVKVYDSSQPPVVNLTTDFYKEYNSALRRKPGEDVQFVVHVTAFPNISSYSFTWFKDGIKLMDVKPTSVLFGQQQHSSLMTSSLFQARSTSLLLQDSSQDASLTETTASHSGHITAVIEGKQAILRITSVKMKDSGVYSFIANNTSDESISASVSMILRVDGPPLIEISNDRSAKEYFLSDTKYILSCTVFAPDVEELFWRWLPCSSSDQCFEALHAKRGNALLNGKWIDISETSDNDPRLVLPEQSVNVSSDVLPDKRLFVNTLNLTVIAKTSGYYSCSAVNDMGSVRKDSLFVVTEARNGFQIFTSTSEPVEGDSVKITCIASRFRFASNDSSILSWSFIPTFMNDAKSGSILLNVSRGDVSVNKPDNVWKVMNSLSDRDIRSDLILSPAKSLDHSGSYTCVAKTFSEGIPRSTSVRTDLYIEKPEGANITFSNMNGTTIERQATSSLELFCEVSGRPTPKIIWSKYGKPLNTSETGIEVSASGERLLITRLASSDSGKYECLAQNSVSKDGRLIVLRVLDDGNTGKSKRSYLAIITVVVIFGGICLVLGRAVNKRNREDRRQNATLNVISSNLFDQGQMGMFNPNLPLDEQAALLPYDSRWEFPRKRLKLGKILGQGAFGRVVIGEAVGLNDDEPSTTVAIKMLKERCDEQQRQALIAELKILIHLGRHVNIVNLLAAVTTELARGELLVVVEYCKHGNLREFLLKNRNRFIDQIDPETGKVDNRITTFAGVKKRKQIFNDYENVDLLSSTSNHSYVNSVVINPEYENLSVKYTNLEVSNNQEEEMLIKTSDIICYCFQVARGMEYLASKKLIHRDLAARNVLLAEDGVVKICDFGLAKDCFKYDEYVKKGNGPLPIKWMAIESIGDKVFSTKSDVWSFGVLCWELFSLGGDPYPGEEINQEFFKKLKRGVRMERPNYCPDYFYSDIISRCWSEDPDFRPEFKDLTDVIGDFLESSVRLHYVDLNDPYQQMNEVLFVNNDGYLSLMPIDDEIQGHSRELPNGILVDLTVTDKDSGENTLTIPFTDKRSLIFTDLLSVDKRNLRPRNYSLQDDFFMSKSPDSSLDRKAPIRSVSSASSLRQKNYCSRPSNFDIIQRLSNSTLFNSHSCVELDKDASSKKHSSHAVFQESFRRRMSSVESLDINSNSNSATEGVLRLNPPPSSYAVIL